MFRFDGVWLQVLLRATYIEDEEIIDADCDILV